MCRLTAAVTVFYFATSRRFCCEGSGILHWHRAFSNHLVRVEVDFSGATSPAIVGFAVGSMSASASLYFTIRFQRGFGGNARQRLHSYMLANSETRCRIVAITCITRHGHGTCFTDQGHGGARCAADFRCFDLETNEPIEGGCKFIALDRLRNADCCNRMRLALRAGMGAFRLAASWWVGADWAGWLVAG